MNGAGQAERVLEAARGPGHEEMEGHPLRDSLRRAVAAAHLAGVRGVTACVPALRWPESVDYPRASGGSIALRVLEILHL